MSDASDALSFVRIKELELSPIAGNFDAEHLQAIHRHIFQDSAEHLPGEFRPPTATYIKGRSLETSRVRYQVGYASNLGEGAENTLPQTLSSTLDQKTNPANLSNLDKSAFCKAMAELYTDLDYLHPFVEGNSRTLRVFTRSLARTCGYDLDWSASHADGHTRDELYVARDLAVTEKRFPGLDFDKACDTPNRAEQQAWLQFKSKFREHMSLEQFIERSTSPTQASIDVQQAGAAPAQADPAETRRLIQMLKAEPAAAQDRADRYRPG